MKPSKPLPYSDEFSSADEYIDALLNYVTTTPIFQMLCGGVHIMDFYITDPGLFYSVIPEDWQTFLLDREPMELLDFVLREDLDKAAEAAEKSGRIPPPETLVQYVRDIRRFSLRRELEDDEDKPDAASKNGKPNSAPRKPPATLARQITTGMSRKKVHEVTRFADYVDRLADVVSSAGPDQDRTAPITHLVDFGSGQNYLGRALASPPYNRRVVAIESRSHNIKGAKGLDIVTGLAVPSQIPMRNKKVYLHMLAQQLPPEKQTEKMRNKLARTPALSAEVVAAADMRSVRDMEPVYTSSQVSKTTEPITAVDAANAAKSSKQGHAEDLDKPIQYVEGRLKHGDLKEVLEQVPSLKGELGNKDCASRNNYLGVSIHSCGNLSHYGLRALMLNPDVRAVAIIGCCYNLLTDKLGPPTFKLPGIRRPTLQAVNGRAVPESERLDPEGFPMSEHLSTYKHPRIPGDGGRANSEETTEDGIRFNITARMMACQAPGNWTPADSESFFTRHFYRAVLQRIFLDREVVARVRMDEGSCTGAASESFISKDSSPDTPLNTAVHPIIIGSLGKSCYASLPAYVRGAVTKILGSRSNGDATAREDGQVTVHARVAAKMGSMTDQEVEAYVTQYEARKRELSAVWTLMAFSAGVVESVIVADRWLYLREQQAAGVVHDCWVENVFSFAQSPRNLVVVGIKR